VLGQINVMIQEKIQIMNIAKKQDQNNMLSNNFKKTVFCKSLSNQLPPAGNMLTRKTSSAVRLELITNVTDAGEGALNVDTLMITTAIVHSALVNICWHKRTLR
jgi:hypothetical protein